MELEENKLAENPINKNLGRGYIKNNLPKDIKIFTKEDYQKSFDKLGLTFLTPIIGFYAEDIRDEQVYIEANRKIESLKHADLTELDLYVLRIAKPIIDSYL